MSEQNTCPPQRAMVMPWQNTAMVPIRWRYLYIVLLWFDTFRTHKFNLRRSVAAAGWPFNHPRIHNRPSLPIRKHCWLSNTSILSCGTQLKISCCWRTSWWVLHSINWSMSSDKAETMARYRLVNRIHVMKSFPNAAQVVRWSTRCLGFSRQRCPDCRKNARLPVAEHASNKDSTPCTCLTWHASCLNLFGIPLHQCSCPKV